MEPERPDAPAPDNSGLRAACPRCPRTDAAILHLVRAILDEAWSPHVAALRLLESVGGDLGVLHQARASACCALRRNGLRRPPSERSPHWTSHSAPRRRNAQSVRGGRDSPSTGDRESPTEGCPSFLRSRATDSLTQIATSARIGRQPAPPSACRSRRSGHLLGVADVGIRPEPHQRSRLGSAGAGHRRPRRTGAGTPPRCLRRPVPRQVVVSRRS